ncbi:MAG: ankyrin repeat domain-containing protein [Endozoicomonadaceae bacterium]|nr:ankyrin repeat domain-containing protein [Endozoicomonadaceae bacterium]
MSSSDSDEDSSCQEYSSINLDSMPLSINQSLIPFECSGSVRPEKSRYQRNIQIAECTLNASAKISVKLAVNNGNHETLDRLLKSENTDSTDSTGQLTKFNLGFVLRNAIKYSDKAIAEKMAISLINAGADLQIEYVCLSKTVLHYAIYYKQYNVLKTILENNANVNGRDFHVDSNKTPLEYSIFKRDMECFQLLLSYKPELLVSQLMTAITVAYNDQSIGATENKNIAIKMALSLINAGTIKCETSSYEPVMLYAIDLKHTPIIEALLNIRRIDVNCRDTKGRSTFLYYAASRGYYDCVNLLLFHKANVNGFDENNTPLSGALDYEHADTAVCLVENGAVVNSRDEKRYCELLENNRLSDPRRTLFKLESICLKIILSLCDNKQADSAKENNINALSIPKHFKDILSIGIGRGTASSAFYK